MEIWGRRRLRPEAERRIEMLFPPEHREAVRKLLLEDCGHKLPFLAKIDRVAMDRFRLAALQLSGGDGAKLDAAIQLAKTDWRDRWVAAGFADTLAVKG
jgi:hypothetical protein